MENREIEEKKALIRIMAKQIGLIDFDINFIKKDAKRNYNDKTLEGMPKVEYWIDRVYNHIGLDLKEKNRTTKNVMYRFAFINIMHNDLIINKFAISEGLQMNHTTILHSINESNKWLEVQDPQFMEYYNEIKKLIIEK
jgi:hypothetical protein